jgi:hypothetical protein
VTTWERKQLSLQIQSGALFNTNTCPFVNLTFVAGDEFFGSFGLNSNDRGGPSASKRTETAFVFGREAGNRVSANRILATVPRRACGQ